MAPNLSGVAVTDTARMADLVELAIQFAVEHMKNDGRAGDQGVPWRRLQPVGRSASSNRFRVVKAIKPKASRDKSAETFWWASA